MILEINEKNPNKRLIDQTVQILESGGVIIYPTDTVYAYGCDSKSKSAIEKIYRIKNIQSSKRLSFILSDISSMNDYVRNISDQAFKIMKKCVPGPYTFIFHASKLVPKIAITKQKTIGVRIPDNNIALDLVRTLGRPIISAGVQLSDDTYVIDPENLQKENKNFVDIIIDAGVKSKELSTVVDFTSGKPVVIREGKGEFFF
jgi:tRNA threonylcarbamoyl adenosine modification protein (Sua5/YciO/YrdC/YwlC family)